jgi:gas vesicle protein
MGLGSSGSTSEETDQPQREADQPTVSQPALLSSVSDPLPSDVSNVQQRLAGFVSAIQESLKANQECVRADINSVKDDINNIKAEIRAEIIFKRT